MVFSDDSDLSEQSQQNDMARLQSIWNELNQVKNLNTNMNPRNSKFKKDMKQVIHAQHHQKQAIYTEHQQQQYSAADLARKYKRERENTTLMMTKLHNAYQEIDVLKQRLQGQMARREELEVELEHFHNQESQQQNYDHQNHHSYQNKPQPSQGKAFNNLLAETNTLQEIILTKDKEIDRLNLKLRSMELDLQKNAKQETRFIQEYSQQLDEHCLSDKAQQLLELTEAQRTIQRLLALLKGTPQYHAFVAQNQGVKELHCLQNIPKRVRNGNLSQQNKKMCSCMEAKRDQRVLWTPAAAYKLLLTMKIKYEYLSEDCVEEVLYELNKIWIAREDSRLKKMKEHYEGEIKKLKSTHEVKYDEVVARKQIERLKKELINKKKNKVSKNKQENIDNFKNIGQYQDQLRLKSQSIKLLNQRVRLLEAEAVGYDKGLYLQGALWLIDKVLAEIENTEEQTSTFQSHFREKITVNMEPEDWFQSYKSFFESISEIQGELCNKLFSLKQNLLQKVNTIKKPVDI